MSLYNEIGYYRAITEAETKAQSALHIKRFVESVLRRVKLPLEVRGQFIEDVYNLFYELWGTDVPERLANTLSTLYLLDDVTGAVAGEGKYAPCSSFEYSFFSYKKERRIAQEDLFKESEFGDMLENSKKYGTYMKEGDFNIWLEGVIAHSNFREDEDFIFRKSVLEGISLRELDGIRGLSKSTWGRRLALAREKFKKAAKKYGGRGG